MDKLKKELKNIICQNCTKEDNCILNNKTRKSCPMGVINSNRVSIFIAKYIAQNCVPKDVLKKILSSFLNCKYDYEFKDYMIETGIPEIEKLLTK